MEMANGREVDEQLPACPCRQGQLAAEGIRLLYDGSGVDRRNGMDADDAAASATAEAAADDGRDDGDAGYAFPRQMLTFDFDIEGLCHAQARERNRLGALSRALQKRVMELEAALGNDRKRV